MNSPKYNLNRKRPPYVATQRRIRFVFALLVLGYLLLGARLGYLQVKRHAYYLRQAPELLPATFSIPATRGEIFDRNGHPLAVNVTVGDINADPSEIKDPVTTASALAACLFGAAPNHTAQSIANSILEVNRKSERLHKKLRYVSLIRSVDFAQVQALRSQQKADDAQHNKHPAIDDPLVGITVRTRTVRAYPENDLAAQVLGFVSIGPAGKAYGAYGVEKSCDSQLAGHEGSVTAQTDASGSIIPESEQAVSPVRNGSNVTLTIDSWLQARAQDALERAVGQHLAQSGSIVVLDPANGDILALANSPTFSPGNLKGTNYSEWDDRAVSDLYEPGSTLKSLTLSAVLDSEGLQERYHTIVCTGELKVGNRIVHCAKDPPYDGVHGVEDMTDVLKNSCNIGAADFALGLGAQKLYNYEKLYGMFDRLDCGLPGAAAHPLTDPATKPWAKIRLANVAFGQGISITALHLASVYATIANGGKRVYPHILLNDPTPRQEVQVISSRVSAAMLSMLRTVVTGGTGKSAQIADYTVGGKTGSAQVAEHGHYGNSYICSFCAVVPLNHPRLVILCVVNKPQGVHWGAAVAAPAVHDLAKLAMRYLQIPPDDPEQADYNDRYHRAGPTFAKAKRQQANNRPPI